jgi:hypothetical protein
MFARDTNCDAIKDPLPHNDRHALDDFIKQGVVAARQSVTAAVTMQPPINCTRLKVSSDVLRDATAEVLLGEVFSSGSRDKTIKEVFGEAFFTWSRPRSYKRELSATLVVESCCS